MPSAQELLAARARRVTVIRQRVIVSILASFVLSWGAVAWDGSMGAEASPATQTSVTETTTSPDSTEPAESAESTDTYSDESAPNDDGSSLSTSQS
jgi:hypothetical protein